MLKNTHRLTAVAAVAAASALALPAAAGAHGSVWQETARLIPTGQTPPIVAGDLLAQTRYVVSNHGYSYVLRETNGKTSKGMLNFQKLPGAYRNQATKTANNKEAWYLEGDSGAQPHATCDVPALSSYATIGSWQGADPFYGYVPFQKTTAGLEDDPANWIPVVQTATGVNLSSLNTAAEFEAACEALPGATASSYVPADTFNSPPTTASPLAPWLALTSSTINEQKAEAVAPLNVEIAAKSAQLADLQAKVAGLESKVASLETAKTAAEKAAKDAEALAKTLADKAAAAEATSSAASARLQAVSTPLGIALGAESFSVKQLATGIAVKITGPVGERAHVRLVVSAQARKALGLRLRTLADVTTTINAAGTTVTLKSSALARLTLAATTSVTVDVSAGGRTVSTTGTLTR